MTPQEPAPEPAVEPEKTHLAREIALDAPLIACRFEPTGRYAFASAEDRTVRRVDLDSDAPDAAQVKLGGHESWVFALAVAPDGQTALTGGGDGRVLAWPVAFDGGTPAPIRSLEAHAGWVRGIAYSPDGTLVATCGNDRKVRLWSADDFAPRMDLPGHERPVYAVAFDPTGSSLFSADLRGQIIEWDHRAGKEMRRYDGAVLHSYNSSGQQVDYGGVRELALSADGKRVAGSGQIEASNPLGAVSNPAVVVFERAAEGEVKPRLFRPKADIKGVAWGLRPHPAGFLIAVSGGTGGGHLWFFRPEAEGDVANEFAHLALPNTGRGLDLHPDGRRLGVAHHDGKFRLYAMTAPPAG